MEIGVCGYGYTGSSALVSLLREFSNVTFLDGGEDFEFTLSYTPDGLEDLEFNLVNNPSKGVRSDISIYRFLLLVDLLERSYNKFTNNTFRQLTQDYLSKLIQVQYKGIRIFEYERSHWKRIEKMARMLVYIKLKKKNIDVRCFPYRNRYLSIYPDDFEEYTKQYVTKILNANGNYDCILLEQPFSCGNPLNSMRFFNNPRCIIVDRDPRDLYVLCKRVFGTSALFIPTNTVEEYIEYYKRLRDDRQWRDSSIVKKIQFEDLIYKYDETVETVSSFLNGIGDHVNKQKFFKPDFSRKNTNIFNHFKEDSEDIVKIEQELVPWLYHFPEDSGNDEATDLNSFTFL